MNLPNGHVSPSSVARWLRCGMQEYLFGVKRFIAPPEVALEVGKQTHRTILDLDLTHRLRTGGNMGEGELLEAHLDGLRKSEDILHAPTLDEEGGLGKLIDQEAVYFERHLIASYDWRHRVTVQAVEMPFVLDLGGVPVEGRIDLVENGQVTDLKRKRLSKNGRRPSPLKPEDVGRSLQLVPYAAATGKTRAAFISLCDSTSSRGLAPVEPASAEITAPQLERVTAIYQSVAERISAGDFPPVDTSSQNGWVCSKRFCGAHPKDARDFVTGQLIACPWGERSATTVSVGGDDAE